MNRSSQKFAFDDRLLAVEELYRQRNLNAAAAELDKIEEGAFDESGHELGLYVLLTAERSFHEADYRASIQKGLRAARVLADFPLNRRYARSQLVLSKSYSAVGDLKNAEIRAHNALAAYRRAGDAPGQVDGLNELARIAFIRSQFDRAQRYVEEAVQLADGDARKVAQLSGNLGTICTLSGDWETARRHLNFALDYNEKHHLEVSQAINLLSLGHLYLRRREFVLAARTLDKAGAIIERQNLRREKVIYLEYRGELALERGEAAKAKTALSEAYHQGRLLAPESALVSQASRRLAEAELRLDNIDEAMKYAQKALELANAVGETAEIGAAHRVVARIYAVRNEYVEAVNEINTAAEVLHEVGDLYECGRTLLIQAEILQDAGEADERRISRILEEAAHHFERLRVAYWVAEVQYRRGVVACQSGDLARGFRFLSKAEKGFAELTERGRVRALNEFLSTLADQAVALSVSDKNAYKVFGSFLSPTELDNVRQGRFEETLQVLLKRTAGSRAIVYAPTFEPSGVISSLPMSQQQTRRFLDVFKKLLGEEVSTDNPTLLLDCRHDPYVNDLFDDTPDNIASVIVVPFMMSDNVRCYLYVDRLANNNGINPFSQDQLDFAVGFSDLICFKAADLLKSKLQEDNRRLKDQLKQEAAFPNIITKSAKMLELLSQVRQVVDSSISLSIEGETGSGKDLLARAIHYNSSRRDKRFISVNCAALPETLLESELFGYRRGAYTGADRDKAGLFEEADCGTFFLDEIADMPLGIQAKLLRVIEEKEIVRLGETTPRKVDVRVISATNKNLKDEIGHGTFRQDLYYRLSALTFRLPPLRERREDIPLLVTLFLDGSGKSISPAAMRYFVAYDWPGNVRELENEVKKLILLVGDAEEIEPSILSSKILSAAGVDVAGAEEEVLPAHVQFSEQYSLYDYLAEHERRFIIQALREQKGVKKHAAAQLNIPESTLRLKIKQYNIDLTQLDAVH
jgi:Nif-specific regulatory protein